MNEIQETTAERSSVAEEIPAWLVTVACDGDIIREYRVEAHDAGEAAALAADRVANLLDTQTRPWPDHLDTIDVDDETSATS